MIKLSKLQNNFVDAAYDESDIAILKSIKNGKAPKEELLDIYRNNLYGSLTNALKITYYKTHEIAGEKAFERFCKEFIKGNRSHSGNLDEYGEGFAAFLKEKNEEFLSNLADLEWLEQTSYLAKDAGPLDVQALQELPQEKLFDVRFKLHPSCFLYSSSYNLFSKRKQNKPLKKESYFVIYRHDFETQIEKITKSEFDFLSGVRNGLSLYEIYEKYEIDIQLSLQKYLVNSVLSEFSAFNS